MLGKIRVETKGQANVKFWRIFLEDHEITRYINRIEIYAASHGIAQITLGLVATVELPDEIQALITVEKQETIIEGIES